MTICRLVTLSPGSFSLQCFLMGALHTGSCCWSARGDVGREIPQTRVTGGLCTGCGVCPGLSGLGGGPCAGAPWSSGLWCLSVWMATHRWLLLTWILSAMPCYQSVYCMCECGRVCWCVWVQAWACVCMCVCVCVWGVGSICGGGRDGLSFFIYVSSFYCFYLVKHFGLHLLMYEKCYINKVWFDLIWFAGEWRGAISSFPKAREKLW